jgi:hypothetical protein
MVAAEAKTGPPRALALGFITNQPCFARGLFDRPFTDSAPGAEETRMATAAAERFASIAHRRRQFRAALRVAAALPQMLGGSGPVPDCVLTGMVCAGK